MTRPRRIRSALLAAALLASTIIGPSGSTAAPGSPSEEELAELWDRASGAGAIGMYRDDDGSVVVALPASKATAFTTSDARATGLEARVVTREIDAATISAIMTRIIKRDWAGAPNSGAFGVQFDAKLGRVVIEGNAAPSAFAPLSQRGQATWNIATPRRRAVGLSRRNELAPIDGGAAAFDGDTSLPSCTTGFTIKVGGQSRMVTAGHCFALTEAVWSQGSGISFGTVVSRALFPAQDMEILGGAAYSQRIYVGDQTGALEQVSGVADPSLTFDNYCYSGWVSGERCGNNVTSLNAMYCDPGCTINLAAFVGPTVAQNGDSGAPFYIANSNSTNGVRGMVVARAGNTMYAHKWSTIRDWWGATWP